MKALVNGLQQPRLINTRTRPTRRHYSVVTNTLRTVKESRRLDSPLSIPKLQQSIQSIVSPEVKQPSTRANENSFDWEVITLVGLSTAVAFICSIDRAAMSVAILPMSHQFAWDDSVKGAVSSAFFAGYMITNLTGGYLATRYSSKGILALGVVLWSCFTILTPTAAMSSNASGSLNQLLIARGAMGVGEGVSYPAIQNLVCRWVPEDSRSRALAFIYSGHQLGTLCSYLLAPVLIAKYGWESVFWIFGGLGFLWLLGWGPLVKNQPESALEEKNAVSNLSNLFNGVLGRKGSESVSLQKQEEHHLRIQDVPWAEFAKSKPFWAIVAAQITVGCGSTLSFAWLPTFYTEVYGVDVSASAAFSVVPFLATVVATNAAGWIADNLTNNGILTKTDTRKLMQAVASLGPAACLLKLAADQGAPGGHVGGVMDAVVMITAWLALGGFSAAGYGSNHQDISGKWAGILFGLSNGLASLAGSFSIYMTGRVLHEYHDWGLIFSAAAGLYLVGAGAYLAWGSAEEQFGGDDVSTSLKQQKSK